MFQFSVIFPLLMGSIFILLALFNRQLLRFIGLRRGGRKVPERGKPFRQ